VAALLLGTWNLLPGNPTVAQQVSWPETTLLQQTFEQEVTSDSDTDMLLQAMLERLQKAEARLAELGRSEAESDDQPSEAEPSEAQRSEAQPSKESAAPDAAEEPVPRLRYGSNGFRFETDDEKFALSIQNRIQVRYAYPFDRDPRVLEDLDREQSSFMVRRARTRMRGHAYHPWLEYYLQYDWTEPILRDMNLTIAKYKWASLEVGRTKVVYNDERKTSSANQQFVNRSIVNDIFTVDRQQGLQLFGNLFPETWHDTTYYLGAFTGLGVGERNNDDDHLMYNVRLQWNAMGGEMPFSQSDIEYHEQPALNFAVAANTNRSSCLAFETSANSCRPLPWAPYDTIGAPGQYRVNQMMGEARFKWLGFSLLHEMHVKEINDKLVAEDDPFKQTTMLGGFLQAGYFPHYDMPVIPKNLEFAGRYAFVDPRLAVGNITQEEISGVVTYFLNGHNNKVNFQVSQLTLDPANVASRSEQRYWVQWDLTF
jgi:phosphate-selective porin OprO and OprP